MSRAGDGMGAATERSRKGGTEGLGSGGGYVNLNKKDKTWQSQSRKNDSWPVGPRIRKRDQFSLLGPRRNVRLPKR